jgi:N-acyl-D-amino-acid deacylase
MPNRTLGPSHEVTSQDAAISPAARAWTRRGVLAGAAALAVGGNIKRAFSVGVGPDPFHDPTYATLPLRIDLVGRLKPAARAAQAVHRMVNGIQVTGLPLSIPEFDDKIASIMASSGIPGVSMALAKNNALVLARGYGRASLVGNVLVEPTTPATIMSISKTITAMAALMLVRDGKLRLNDLAFDILRDGPLGGNAQSVDRRQYRIEVRHLMNHTSGLFNAVEILNDPPRFQGMARSGIIRLMHGRIGQNDLVRLGMNKPLQFDPGEKFAYSGQGMQVLARVVEKISGLRLDHYIQARLFDPLGIRSYYVGSYLSDEQFAAVIRPNRDNLYGMAPSLYDKQSNSHRPRPPNTAEYVSWGGADACGWGSLNALDLLRYVSAVPSMAGPELWQQLIERPLVNKDAAPRAPGPFGLGWAVFDRGGRKGINFAGGWPGEQSFAELRPDGTSLAVLINSDDAVRFRQINAAAQQLLERVDTLQLPSPSWQDYGFA